MIRVPCRGQTLALLPERAALWEEERALLIADAHFGKSHAFRRAGIPIPDGTTEADLARLDALLARHDATRILFLGDFTHVGRATDGATLDAVARWRTRHRAVEMHLILGNHDRGLDAAAAALGLTVGTDRIEGPFHLRHEPTPAPDAAYEIAGHLHPAVRLSGPGGLRLRAPCFWFRAAGLVLPAFGGFTGAMDVEPAPDDGVYVVGDGEIAAVRPWNETAPGKME